MENKNRKTIKEVLWNEVTVGLTIASTVIGVVLFITGPDAQMKQDIALLQKDIETIEKNHIAHIQKDIEEIESRQKSMDEKIDEMKESLTEILVKLEK